MAKQLGFYLDASACTACKACAMACKDKNNLPVGINWRRVYEYGGGSWVPDPAHSDMLVPNNVYAYSVSIACMHCQDAKCVEVCPAGAMSKNADGVVLIDADKCIGCRLCEWACPYGGPQYDEANGVMTKCNFCVDLQAEGKNPACVDACVMRVLEFGELDDLRARHGVVNSIAPLPDGSFTNPSFVVTPHRHAQASGSSLGEILGLPEEN